MNELKMDEIERYIEWVSKKIDQVKEYSSKINRKDVNIQDVKEILQERVNVGLMLNVEYQRYKTEKSQLETRFKVWWSDKYTEKRQQLNPTSLAATKWASKGDVESAVIAENKEEYVEFQDKLDSLEHRSRFLLRLMEDWNSISYDCSSLIRIFEIEERLYANIGGRSDLDLKENQVKRRGQ